MARRVTHGVVYDVFSNCPPSDIVPETHDLMQGAMKFIGRNFEYRIED